MKLKKLRNLNLLIKPASCNCNLRCEYCFYFDVAKNRQTYSYGYMSYETLENLVKNAFETVEYEISFLFQGGEPLMRGISFYYKFHEFVEKYNINNIKVYFNLQTNGVLLNERWFDLFKKYDYLIGVSIDGTKDIHDIFRIDIRQRGTFDSIKNNIEKLRARQISFNILTVINNKICENIEKVYEYYKQNDFRFMQFIPCLDPLEHMTDPIFLSAKNYGYFLDKLFNLWYEDFKAGNLYYIRYFENLIMILDGKMPESCDMLGKCSVNLVIEADGSAYPCDFYTTDEYKIGNINTENIFDIVFCEKAMGFIKKSLVKNLKCKDCKYLKICKTGCKRYKNGDNLFKYCDSYIYFLDKNLKKLIELKNELKSLGVL